MQENEQQNGQWHGNKCQGGYCGCGGHHHMGFHILRWILGIIIILMVFSFGMQIGEFKAALENGGAYGGAYGGYHQMMLYRSQPSVDMMYGGSGAVVTPATVQVQGSTGVTK